MNKNYEAVKASPVIRIGAALVDLFLTMLLLTVLSSLIVSPILSGSEKYQTSYEIYSTGLVSTGLYVEDEQNSGRLVALIDAVSDAENGTTFSLERADTYDQALIQFYTFYSQEKVSEYLETKKTSGIFTYDSGTDTFSLTEGVSATAAYSFFSGAYTTATSFYLERNEAENQAYRTLRTYATLSNVLCIGISVAIVYLLIPLLLKDGRTLGKKLFAMKVMSAKDYTAKAKWYQILLREVFFVCVELILSYFTYMVPLLLGTVFLCANKKHVALHDYVGGTLVVDANKWKAAESGPVPEGEGAPQPEPLPTEEAK